MPAATCQFCLNGKVAKCCTARMADSHGEDMILCTRVLGHPGWHVACGDSEDLHDVVRFRDLGPEINKTSTLVLA